MTIDEEIQISKEIANTDIECPRNCIMMDCSECEEEHKKLAEWLEELKAYREIGTVEGYKSAIECYMEEYNRRKSEEPTAYDIDKVVEELEKAKTINVDVGFGTIYKTIRKDVALEIVKQGGVTGDVCEWRCDIYGRWHTKCHTLSGHSPSEFEYCPYCGKKIKVVE